MKKLILFAAILFAGVSVVNAQGQNVKLSKTDRTHNSVLQGEKLKANTNLTVKLNSIQSISVNTSNVTLEYTTVEDYQKGVSSGIIEDHLQVYSTGAYNVKVNYSGEDNNYTENTVGGLDAKEMFESIQVAVSPKTGINTGNTFLQKESSGAIISSQKGIFGAMFNVNYRGAANYMNSIKGGNQRTYTAQVTYTIAPN